MRCLYAPFVPRFNLAHSPAMKPIITFGFLGTNLDRASGPERWSRWRPTVAMCQQEDLLISRLELLVEPKFVELAREGVARDERGGA